VSYVNSEIFTDDFCRLSSSSYRTLFFSELAYLFLYTKLNGSRCFFSCALNRDQGRNYMDKTCECAGHKVDCEERTGLPGAGSSIQCLGL
jgi:hypothetical protein